MSFPAAKVKSVGSIIANLVSWLSRWMSANGRQVIIDGSAERLKSSLGLLVHRNQLIASYPYRGAHQMAKIWNLDGKFDSIMALMDGENVAEGKQNSI